MPRKSRSTPKKRRGSRRQNQHQHQNHNDQDPPQHFNQSGGNGLLEGAQNQSQNQGKVEISQATLNQAGQIAQKFLENAMAGNKGQSGGSASGAGGEAENATATTEGLKTAIMEGAVAGAEAGAVAAAEGYSSLKGAPLTGGRRSKGRRHGRRGRSHQNHGDLNQGDQNQKGGMVPGLMTAVETALVPLGLYLGQKALQSRRSGNRSSLGNTFDFRQVSRRTRRRR